LPRRQFAFVPFGIDAPVQIGEPMIDLLAKGRTALPGSVG
jgi:hypothetical protein